VRDTADVLRERALDLAERDVEAFTAVTDAYRLPKGTEGEAEQRSRPIAEAVLGASRPPADVVRPPDRSSTSPSGCCRWATATW